MSTALYESMIAGIKFHELSRVAPPPTIGEALVLEAEPDNLFDQFAIKVLLPRVDKRWMLGYIPRVNTQHVHPLLSNPPQDMSIMLSYMNDTFTMAAVAIFGTPAEGETTVTDGNITEIVNPGVVIDL